MASFSNIEIILYERHSHSSIQQTKKVMKTFTCSCLILFALFVSITPTESSPSSGPSSPTLHSVVSAACRSTLYPHTCVASLLPLATTTSMAPMALFDHSVQVALNQVQSARGLAHQLNFFNKKPLGSPTLTGMDDCIELLDDSMGQLGDVLTTRSALHPDDVRTRLSAALTYQGTCVDGLVNLASTGERAMMTSKANNLTQLISNSLALFGYAQGRTPSPSIRPRAIGGRRLLSVDFPSWVTAADRKLLEATPDELGERLVVAQDGTGTHATIAEALAAAPLASAGGRTVIHVKAGTYKENIKIPARQENVLLVGDGKGQTVITGDRNAADGWTTFQSATVGVTGDGFMARDITFQNTAGPAKHQAVALRVGSDKSVVYRCSIVGYQDSLYTLSNRQFYRDTDIYGTVDFIFGNSAVVFQNCNIYPRKPGSGKKNYVTAQGRTDPNQNTGISIQNCKITASSDLAPVKGSHPTFLGRPWQKYSRTVVMQSYIDDSVHPAGWEPWSGGFALSTLYYGEYMNSGPGAATGRRVSWSGYHPSMTVSEATKFTVADFIFGNSWLPATGVEFDSGLHL